MAFTIKLYLLTVYINKIWFCFSPESQVHDSTHSKKEADTSLRRMQPLGFVSAQQRWVRSETGAHHFRHIKFPWRCSQSGSKWHISLPFHFLHRIKVIPAVDLSWLPQSHCLKWQEEGLVVLGMSEPVPSASSQTAWESWIITSSSLGCAQN